MTASTPSTARYASGAAIVAGGSGGVGAAICRRLAAAGAHVALTYHRGRERAEKVADDVRALGRDAHIAAVDLTDADATRTFVGEVAAKFGGVHSVIYAAGPKLSMRHISALEPDHFRDIVSTDVFGCYNILQASLTELRKTRGAVVALGTPAIRRFAVKDLLSAAPKAAIESIVRGIAAEEGRFGVRANFVGVGVITDGKYHELVEEGAFTEAWLDLAKKILALRRLGSADEIAEVVEFLASDRASFVTGQSLMADGGYAL
jgi:NAD(P)-dependent dehydrogenase (short-subunit alcohol dehydrogenase family)